MTFIWTRSSIIHHQNISRPTAWQNRGSVFASKIREADSGISSGSDREARSEREIDHFVWAACFLNEEICCCSGVLVFMEKLRYRGATWLYSCQSADVPPCFSSPELCLPSADTWTGASFSLRFLLLLRHIFTFVTCRSVSFEQPRRFLQSDSCFWVWLWAKGSTVRSHSVFLRLPAFQVLLNIYSANDLFSLVACTLTPPDGFQSGNFDMPSFCLSPLFVFFPPSPTF